MNWVMDRKIATKLMGGFGVIIALSATLGILSILKLSGVESIAEDIGTNELIGTRTVGKLGGWVATYRRWELRLALTYSDLKGRKASEEGLAQTIEAFKKAQGEYEPWIDADEERALYQTICTNWKAYQATSERLQELLRTGKGKEAQDYLMGESFRAFNMTAQSIEQDVEFQRRMSDGEVERGKREFASGRLVIIAGIVLSTLIGLALAIVIARLISRPTQAAGEMARRIATGDLTGQEIRVRWHDEVGELSRDLNRMQASLRSIIESIAETSQNVANASEEFSAVSQQISANSEETSAQVNVVTTATDQVNRGLQTVATSTEEMSVTIKEIAKNATEAAKVADGAMRTAAETNTIVAKLGESSAEIGQVIKAITSIAQKTDLLALNATVEAARAGEVGAGFAVVANEVKELAKQTAMATEDISRKIEAIQTDAKAAVTAIGSITEVIGQVNNISATIATAVEEQSATTSEMSRNVAEAAKGSGEVAQNIQGVAQAAQSTSHGATDSQKAAKSLAEMSTQLRELVSRFKLNGDLLGRPRTRQGFDELNASPRADVADEEHEIEYAWK